MAWWTGNRPSSQRGMAGKAGTKLVRTVRKPELREVKMAPSDFEEFFARRQEAAEAYVKGDGTPVDRIVPHSGEASFHSPVGDSVVGADRVARRYSQDAKAFAPSGTSRFEVLQKAPALSSHSGPVIKLPKRRLATCRATGHAHPRHGDFPQDRWGMEDDPSSCRYGKVRKAVALPYGRKSRR